MDVLHFYLQYTVYDIPFFNLFLYSMLNWPLAAGTFLDVTFTVDFPYLPGPQDLSSQYKDRDYI